MSNINDSFKKHFGDETNAFTVRAPGRVNLIGEHIDYNDGFVLPMAISLEVTLRVRQREDSKLDIIAEDFGERLSVDLNSISKRNTWIDYIQGVAEQLQKAGIETRGFEGIINSSVPVASGLSSSAAIEVASAQAFLHLAGATMSPVEIALLCQRAENEFVGVNCGIMDQMAVAACIENNALLIDCRSLALEQVPFASDEYAILVTDSAAPRELASSAYNIRRAQCEAGLAVLQGIEPKFKSLRDVTPADVEKYAGALPADVLPRVRHVVEETARTIAAVQALRANDFTSFGEYMNASHRSLSELYEVSSPELDWLTTWARERPGVLGSRLTGAGFGGCTVTLIQKNRCEEFITALIPAYQGAYGRTARCWVCQPANGAGVLPA